MTTIYNHDEQGIFLYPSESDKCQLTGVDLIPALAKVIKPPETEKGSIAIWKDGKWGVFTPTLPKPPTDEELRAAMVISKIKAMQNLKKVGKLNLVLDLMDSLPRDNDVRILWDFSETLHRTDPTLVKVCKEELGLDDEGIDNLFL